jgi:acyl carrier protein
MNDIQSRLSQCFANVFPDVPASELPRTSMASLARWDSVAHITLLSAVSEEFALDLSPDDFEDLTSYSLILDYVERHATDA